MRSQRHFLGLGVALIGIFLIEAVAWSEDRRRPDLFERLKNIDKVVLLPPKIEVCQLDAGGVEERVEAWCTSAEGNVTQAIQQEFKTRSNRSLETFSSENVAPDVKANLDETYALLDAVNASIIFHTYGLPEHRFEEKIENFDYSLGTETQGLRIGSANGLLIVQGEDHIWTGGRQALQTLGIILGLGAAVGTGVPVIPVMGGGTHLFMTLVDAQTGDLLWHNHAFHGGGYDLRNWESALEITKEVLEPFPLLAQHIRDSDE